MKAKLLLIFSLSFYLFSCNGQNTHIPAAITSAAPVKINRFDKELLKLVETERLHPANRACPRISTNARHIGKRHPEHEVSGNARFL